MAQKYRTLVTGRRVREAEKDHTWEFMSKCPSKWLHIDCENGHIYVARVPRGFKEPTQVQIDAAIKSLKQWRSR